MDFQGRTILVTGASRGIGLGFVTELARRGATVLATARDPATPKLAGAQREAPDRITTLSLDVTSDASVTALAQILAGRPIDALINNAGVASGFRGLEKLDAAACMATFDVNAIGPLRVTRALLPNLRAGSGKIVMHITSRMGSIDDNKSGGSYAYRMSKAALNMASKSLSVDLRGDGIASLVAHPGWVKTDMGGSGASVSVDDSVAGLLTLLEGDKDATLARSGRFFGFRGDEIAW
jgi:NAD(P)-dependent dehydrogenase (short-subunit alcohol dehydrogenase family)